MTRIELIPYTPGLADDWDSFSATSRNGTFLFNRRYMDYHAHRFHDNSLIILRDGRIHALFPACRSGDRVSSHAGLTYGGLIINDRFVAQDALSILSAIKNHFAGEGVASIIYKPIPHIYHAIPSEEDLYALFRLDAKLTIRNISSTICRDRIPPFRHIRIRGMRKAIGRGIYVKETEDLATFWKLLSANLRERHHTSPVHTLDEITHLSRLFPDNIRLFGAFNQSSDEMTAGVIMYINRHTAHCQYISSSPEGRESGALDLLFSTLIGGDFFSWKYFDFGISNENEGRFLNEGLIYQKEGFGARAICYDTYIINTK